MSFDYELQDDTVDEDEIVDTLTNAAGVFIEQDIDSKTDCAVSDYQLSVVLVDNIDEIDAIINASICFDCGDSPLELDVTPEELEEEFIETIDDNSNDILIVKNINEIELDTNEAGVDPTTTNTPKPDAKNNETKPSLFENETTIPILLGVIIVLALCVCCIFVVYLRKRRKQKDDNKNQMQKGMELARIVSMSDAPGDDGMHGTSINDNVSTIDVERHSVDLPIDGPTTGGMGSTGTGSRGTGSRGTGSRGTGSHDAEPIGTLGVDDDVGLPGNAEEAIYGDSAALRMWLNNIGMVQYYDTFIQHGFGDAISALQTINDGDLTMMGISKLAHRKIILMQVANNGILAQNVSSINIRTDDIDYGEDLMGLPQDGDGDEDEEDEDDTMYRRRAQSKMENDDNINIVTPGMTPTNSQLTLNGMNADVQLFNPQTIGMNKGNHITLDSGSLQGDDESVLDQDDEGTGSDTEDNEDDKLYGNGNKQTKGQ